MNQNGKKINITGVKHGKMLARFGMLLIVLERSGKCVNQSQSIAIRNLSLVRHKRPSRFGKIALAEVLQISLTKAEC